MCGIVESQRQRWKDAAGLPITVERWFATLTQRCVRRGTHRSTRELERALHRYIELNNAAPKPFEWAKTADDILASIERFCLRTSNSRH